MTLTTLWRALTAAAPSKDGKGDRYSPGRLFLENTVQYMAEIFYAPMSLFTKLPYLAFVPTLIFAASWLAAPTKKRSRHFIAFAAVAWAIYGVYEIYMAEWSKTVSAPIRADLLLIAPLMYVCTSIAAVILIQNRWK